MGMCVTIKYLILIFLNVLFYKIVKYYEYILFSNSNRNFNNIKSKFNIKI